jgi:hypothetical protein
LASRYGDVTASPGPGTRIRGTTTYTYVYDATLPLWYNFNPNEVRGNK